MAGDRPIDPPTDPLDSFIKEAEARWDSVMTWHQSILRSKRTKPSESLGELVTALLDDGFSRKILEDAIIDQCDKLIQDLAQRLYDEANSTKGYD
jgi:hypothetical protein